MSARSPVARVPNGWAAARIGEVLCFEYGKALHRNRRDGGEFPVFGSNGIVGHHSEPLVREPCLVIGRKGAAGAVHRSEQPCWPIDTTYFVRLPQGLNQAFCHFQLGWLRLGLLDTSTAVPGLNRDDAYRVRLRVPPLNEQTRIVAKLDESFSRLDSAVEQMAEAKQRLKGYRQAVLRDAFTGKLTQAWREEQLKDPESPLRREPASALLERIREERGKAEGKRKRRKLPPLDTSELVELPEGWVWTTAEQLSDPTRSISYGVIKLGDYVPDGVPVLRTSNVRSLTLDMRNVKRISPAISDRYRRTVLRGNEVLVAVRGTLGGVVRVPPQCASMNVSREVAVIALADHSAVPALPVLIASSQAQGWLMRNAKGITYVGVNIETLKQMPVPLPPVAEQHLIAAEVERRFSLADALEQSVERSLRQAEQLRQSILKRAFEGKLVPQDPSDEPAVKLLERIRVEREQQAEKQKARRKPRAATKGRRTRKGRQDRPRQDKEEEA